MATDTVSDPPGPGPAPAPVPDAPADLPGSDKSVASTLARLLLRPVEHTLRVRALDHGTLYLCTRTRVYCLDFPAAQLSDALEATRFVLTAIPPDAPELVLRRPQGQPLDELLWAIGMHAVREHSGGAKERRRLRQWPDFSRLPHSSKHLKACTALTAGALNVRELAAASGMSEREADHFLQACQLCGLLEERSNVLAEVKPGLFDQLWQRWLK
jgi:hypothetical protein